MLLTKPTRKLVLEMSVGIVFQNVILAVLAVIFLPRFDYPVNSVLLGLVLGTAAAVIMLLHMALMTEKAVGSQDESYANKMVVAQGTLRKLVFIVAVVVCWKVLKADLLAMVVGTTGMKIGAYLQPLVHKILGGDKAPKEN